MDTQRNELFHEEQRLRQWWVFGIILIVAGVGWWGFLEQIVGGRAFGSKPAPDWVIWLVFLFCGVLMPLGLTFARLVVTVVPEEIRIRWIPFARKTLQIADIQSCEAREYRPIREYGGWGVRWAGRRGTAWNAHGNRGVQLVLAGGKRLLIGSQRSGELAEVISKAHGGL